MSHSTPPSLSATPRETRARRHRRLPPGPSWHTAAWNTVRFGRQTLSFLQELRERYGDLVTLPTVLGPWTLVFHPDGVRHVVQENHFNYRKGGIANQALSLTLGNGLLTNNGESCVLMVPSTTHRHPDFWERPDVFDPERFALERAAGCHRFAYFPFGEARASVSATSLRSPKRSSSWRRSCPAISSASCPEERRSLSR